VNPAEPAKTPEFNTCNVLTNGNVFVTFAGSVSRRTVMSLVSWLHLAFIHNGKEPEIIVNTPPDYTNVFTDRITAARDRVIARQLERRDIGIPSDIPVHELEYPVGSKLEYGMPGLSTSCRVLPGYQALITQQMGLPCYETMSLADFLILWWLTNDTRFPGQRYTLCGNTMRCDAKCPIISYTNSTLPPPLPKSAAVPVAAAGTVDAFSGSQKYALVPLWLHQAMMRKMPEYSKSLLEFQGAATGATATATATGTTAAPVTGVTGVAVPVAKPHPFRRQNKFAHYKIHVKPTYAAAAGKNALYQNTKKQKKYK